MSSWQNLQERYKSLESRRVACERKKIEAETRLTFLAEQERTLLGDLKTLCSELGVDTDLSALQKDEMEAWMKAQEQRVMAELGEVEANLLEAEAVFAKIGKPSTMTRQDPVEYALMGGCK